MRTTTWFGGPRDDPIFKRREGTDQTARVQTLELGSAFPLRWGSPTANVSPGWLARADVRVAARRFVRPRPI
jgi:hypothetical protein